MGVVICQYISSMPMLPSLQSAYRPNHTVTILRALSDILQVDDQGGIAILVLLDLSAACDTVDYDIPIWPLAT